MISFSLLALVSFALADDPAPAPPVAAPETVAPPAVAPQAAPPVAPEGAAVAAMVTLDPPTDPRFGLELALGIQVGPESSFTPDPSRRTIGIGARYQVTPAIGVDLALTHSYDGGSRGFYDYAAEESGGDYFDVVPSLSTTLLTERLDLGVRAEAPITHWFHPFAKLAAVGALSVARLDEDTEDPTNLTQLSRAGFNGGGYLAGGVAFPIHVRHQVHIVPSLELGYSLLSPIALGNLGSLQQSGVTFRFASGVSF